jgi:hypothetical protein
VERAENEHTLYDPKDSELYLHRVKPEEILVEGAWGMSWRQKTMTGVEDCEKSGVVVKQTLIPDDPDGTAGPEDGLYTKPALASYPAYLTSACGGDACTTIEYKSATRKHIESLGYDIVANFGDQYSDLKGGYADRTFKLPNPNYFLP